VVVENVPGLLGRGLGKVLADLASVGFDAEWQVLPAAAFGAPHIRERVFVLAYTKSEQGDRRERGRIQPLSDWWSIESPVCKLANGIPNRVAQLKCLGNAIVPQVAQFVGECIMAHNGGEFTFAELFCGIGGFRLGFEWASGREETT
jgi:DNA (cytosine-5)-methyltransferase 1